MPQMLVKSRRYLPSKGCYELRLEDGSRLWASLELDGRLSDTLSRDDIAQLLAESEYLHARDYALRAIGRREHFAKEIWQRLEKRQMSQGVIGRVLREMTDGGLVDDERAARAFTEEKLSRALVGPFRIISDLVKRGLGKDEAHRIVTEVSPLGYEEDALTRFVKRRAAMYQKQMAAELERVLGDSERTKKLGGRTGALRHLRAKYLAKIRSKLVGAGFTGELALLTAQRIVREE